MNVEMRQIICPSGGGGRREGVRDLPYFENTTVLFPGGNKQG